MIGAAREDMVPAMPSSVSIILRTQGLRPALLRRALDSALAQTWRPLEVIVVEDGGATLAEFVSKAAAPEGVTLRHVPLPACGRSAAGNAGLRAARGDLLGFLDDDDGLEPTHIATLCDLLERSPEAVAAYAFANEVSVKRDGGETARRIFGHVPFSRTRLWLGNAMPIQAVLFRRSLFDRLGGLDEDLGYLEDWELWLRYSAEGDFVGTPAVTSFFQVPAERSELKKRALLHEAELPRILSKHTNLSARVTLPEVRAVEESLRQGLEETIGARWCLARIWRRMISGH